MLILAGLYLLYYLRENASSDTSTAILGTRTVSQIQAFKDALAAVANAVESETGIVAALGVTQAALESSYGNSDLSRPSAVLSIYVSKAVVRQGPANNLFGFKTGSAWINAGNAYVLVPTTDYYAAGKKMPDGNVSPRDNFPLKWPAPFRAYDSWEASYRDWARLMQTASYIADGSMDALTSGDMQAFGVAMAKRYAPNQNYDQRLIARAVEMGTLA